MNKNPLQIIRRNKIKFVTILILVYSYNLFLSVGNELMNAKDYRIVQSVSFN